MSLVHQQQQAISPKSMPAYPAKIKLPGVNAIFQGEHEYRSEMVAQRHYSSPNFYAPAQQYPIPQSSSPLGYYQPHSNSQPATPYAEYISVPYSNQLQQPIPQPPIFYYQPQHQQQIVYLAQPAPEVFISLPKQATAWTLEDDALLRHLKEERKLGWREIANYFPRRTPNACQFRWRRIVAGVVVTPKFSVSSVSCNKKDLSAIRKKNYINTLLN